MEQTARPMKRDTTRITPGALIIARHGRPHVDRRVKLTWREYIDWWGDYDRAGLAPEQPPPQDLVEAARQADIVYSSPLPRAVGTAEAVALGREIIQDPVFLEAPLPPPPIWGRRSPRAWGVWSRVAWWLGRHAGQETRKEAELRAEAAAATLIAHAAQGETVVLLAHGWFNRMMRPILRRHGWRCVRDGGDKYWAFRRYEKKRR